LIDFNYWAYVEEIWVIFGLFLIIADIFLGFNFFVLPAGIAALIISGLLYLENRALLGDFVLFETWRTVIFSFAVVAIVSVGILKLVFQRKKNTDSDVNTY